MPPETTSLDLDQVPQLQRLAEEVRTTGRARVLRHEQAGVEVTVRVRPQHRRRTPRGQRFTKDDALFRIIGIADRPDDPITDVSANKHKYLAEASADLHE